jgi:thiamine biosynthesis lipoprotein
MFDEPGLRYTHQAMRTTFEFFFPSSDSFLYQGIAEDCANEVSEIELAISPYQEGSDIQRLNYAAGNGEWIRIGWPTHKLLLLCNELMHKTNNAFNPFNGRETMRVSGKLLDTNTLSILDQEIDATPDNNAAIEFCDDAPLARLSLGKMIDVGAIGKGWALDKCAALALDAGVERAFFHAGGSSMLAIGSSWPIVLPGIDEEVLLSNVSLSVSRRINQDAGGIHIVSQTRHSEHIDIVARVVGPSCAITDALSTAAVSAANHQIPFLPEYDIRAVILNVTNLD